LLGAPGAGKTTTLLAFARDRVAARLHDSRAPLPILVPISTWDSIGRTPLPDWIASQVPTLDRDTVASQVSGNNALLMLDGLDELGRERSDTDGRFDPRKRFITYLPEDGPIIITCRDKEYADLGAQLALTGAVTLKELTDLQIHEYLADMPALWQTLETDQGL